MVYLDILVNKVLNMYFNLNSNVNLDKKFIRRRTKERHRSANKIFLSKAEIKHFNDKVIITLYTYNNTKKLFAKKLSKLYRRIFAYVYVSKKIIKKSLSPKNLVGNRKLKMIKLIAKNKIKISLSRKFFNLKKRYK
jgi:hypothetical protein